MDTGLWDGSGCPASTIVWVATGWVPELCEVDRHPLDDALWRHPHFERAGRMPLT